MKKLLPAVTGVTPPNRHSTRTKPSRRHGASAPGRIVTLLCHFVTGGVTATARVGRARDARDTLVRVRELRVLLTREPERKCHARHGVTPRGSAELLRFAKCSRRLLIRVTVHCQTPWVAWQWQPASGATGTAERFPFPSRPLRRFGSSVSRKATGAAWARTGPEVPGLGTEAKEDTFPCTGDVSEGRGWS